MFCISLNTYRIPYIRLMISGERMISENKKGKMLSHSNHFYREEVRIKLYARLPLSFIRKKSNQVWSIGDWNHMLQNVHFIDIDMPWYFDRTVAFKRYSLLLSSLMHRAKTLNWTVCHSVKTAGTLTVYRYNFNQLVLSLVYN